MQRLSERPDLWVCDHFLDAPTAAALRARVRDEALLTEVSINETGLCAELPIDGEPLFEELRGRIEALFGLQSDIFDTLRYRRYGPGEGHPVHLDCYAIEDRELIATALVSLRDTPKGGETTFPAVDLAVAPREGRLVCWYNHRPDGARDPASRHGGAAVLEGEKEVLLYFIYKTIDAAAHRPMSEAAHG